MNINFFTKNTNILNFSPKINNYLSLVNFGKRRENDRDSFVPSDKPQNSTNNKYPHAKLTPEVLDKIKQMTQENKTRFEIMQEVQIGEKTLIKAFNILGIKNYIPQRIRDLINQIQLARENGELRSETCQKLGIDEKEYIRLVRIGNFHNNKKRNISPEIIQKIIELRNQHKTYEEISAALGIRFEEVHNIIKNSPDIPKKKKSPPLPPLSDEMKQAILEDYKNSKSHYGGITRFCKEHNIKPQQYSKVIEESGQEKVKHAGRCKLTEEDYITIKKMVDEKVPRSEIMKKFNLGRDGISSALHRLGIYNYRGSSKDDVLINEIIAARNAGEKSTVTCQRLGISMNKYKDCVKTNKMPTTRKRFMTEELKQKVKELREQGKSNLQISNELDVPIYVVTDIIRLSPDIKRRKMNFNTNNKRKTLFDMEDLHEKIKKLREEHPDAKNKELAKMLNIDYKLFYRVETFYAKLQQNNTTPQNETTKVQQKTEAKNKTSNSNKIEKTNTSNKEQEMKILSKAALTQPLEDSDLLKIFNKYQSITGKLLLSGKTTQEKIDFLEKLVKYIQKILSIQNKELKTYSMFEKLLNAINNNITKLIEKQNQPTQPQKAQTVHNDKLPNKKWLVEKDFKNKIFSHELIMNIAIQAGYPKEEIEKCTDKLKEAFPDDCVILISYYDYQNTNNPNEQKYSIKGRFYESNDGIKTGYFGTKKLFKFEFNSDRKHVYENLVNCLINNKNKLING